CSSWHSPRGSTPSRSLCCECRRSSSSAKSTSAGAASSCAGYDERRRTLRVCGDGRIRLLCVVVIRRGRGRRRVRNRRRAGSHPRGGEVRAETGPCRLGARRYAMKPRTRRFAWIAAGLGILGLAAALVLSAFQSNLVFFFTPSQIAAKESPQGRPFRVGGLVESGSLPREPDSLTVRFRVTDTAKTIPVSYTGLLPDLFNEGKGVVAQGTLGPDGIFHASEATAKHDVNYMPPEAKAAVDQAQKGMTMQSLHQDNKAGR